MRWRNPDQAEEKEKLKACELLGSDRVRLLMDQPFIGAILIRQNLVPVVDSRCPTASTDGQNIFVNPAFYLGMTPGERRFLLAHEVWHTVYLHFLRRKERDKELFNAACDMEINRMLSQERFKIPEGALLPPDQWCELNAEEMYEKLKNSSRPPDSRYDVHLEPEENSGVEQENASGKDDGGEIVIDPDYQVDFGSDPEERAREKVVEAAIQYEKQRGTLPANLTRIVENFRSGKLHWKELLAQFVTSCFGGSRFWLPPNRRYVSSGLYLQSRRSSRLQAVLAIDTSGSTHNDLPQFAAELTGLLNSFGDYQLKVICCDSRIQSVENFTPYTPFEGGKIKFSGGGGTSFTPVFNYLEKSGEEVNLLIYFTDGFGDTPEKPPYPVMWIITPDGRNSIPWGYEAKLSKDL
jgi:predicted metal-dependent peptidase